MNGIKFDSWRAALIGEAVSKTLSTILGLTFALL